MSLYKMPSLGADMASGILAEWKVKEGDRVKKGDVIADIETSKGVIEDEVYEDGIVEKILAQPGTEYPVGTPLALIRIENESDEELRKELEAVLSSPSKKKSTGHEKPSKEAAAAETKEEKGTGERHVRATPLARKRARELGVDLALLASRVKGKISVRNVEAAAKESGAPEKADGMRQAIATAMSRSNAEIPHYYLSTPINMTPALSWLQALNAKRSITERILPAALLIRAVVEALKEVPELNGFWKEGALQKSEEIHPGVAIALRKGGLITPALLDAHTMNLDETMQALRDLIARTRSGRLRSSEITRQTVTITNLGDLGVERVYGIIYPSQVALVGFGHIADSPWVEGDALAIRKVMQATVAGDHRATDGRTGALFLDRLDRILQKPEELL
jgi:pyruvate dehydrogenase E2 component (dihydrolipoamide acetyltransferase)